MTDIAFDAPETVKDLSDSGFDARQAEAITAAMRRAISQGVATKANLTALETRMTVRLYAGLFAAVVAQIALTVGLSSLFQG